MQPPGILEAGVEDAHELAVALVPVLNEACGGRLGPIEWFRAAWQRGGASTGMAFWRCDDGSTRAVMVKLPVGPVEYRWTVALGADNGEGEAGPGAAVTPRVLAYGSHLGGYDLAWLVMEKLAGEPLWNGLHERAVQDLLRASFDFQRNADRVGTVSGDAPTPKWEALIERARVACKAHAIPEAQRWNDHLHKVQRALPRLEARWSARPITAWCHGDLHPGNALRRMSGNGSAGQVVLIDLALVHPGHWAEDALYFERQFWGHSGLLFGIKPVSVIAKLRRQHGLAVDDYAELANIRRVLMAGCAPALVEREGNPRYLHAALETIDRVLPQVLH